MSSVLPTLTFVNKVVNRDSTVDGRWTKKPICLSRVQLIDLNVSSPSEMYDLKLFGANACESKGLLRVVFLVMINATKI